jgi:adenosylmethionine-8-amino-7-oxononanoate aminotransferase
MDAFDRMQRTFVRGEGRYLVDSQGRRVFDAVSSIWTTVHGHCHPHIVEAIAKQAAILDHATLLGASHSLAEELAEQLTALAGMDYAFFASDGASAVEAALKMALHYWRNDGQMERTRFVHLTDAYHGDTAGAMSVSDIAVFKSRYGALTVETLAFDEGAQVVQRDDVAAVIVEPIVQAAAGMRIVPPERYDALRSMTPLLIVDEIATGFGRTGTMFASEQLDLQPDIMCVGKGVTGGTLALSATLVRERVYDAFRGRHEDLKHFFHGHSYAGNPVACAAALANIELFEREQTLRHVRELAVETAAYLGALRSESRIRVIRQAGLMIGIEVDADARALASALYERGHFTRPIGNVVQLVPPLCARREELQSFLESLRDVLNAG